MASVASLLCSNKLDCKVSPRTYCVDELLYALSGLYSDCVIQRSHEQMPSGPRRPSCNPQQRGPWDQTSQTSSESLFNLSIPPLRRGFDLRRPIMSQPRRDVIDLTEDTSSPPEAHTIPPSSTHTEPSSAANRPPRFDRNIINIDEQENASADLREESPEIQFLTSRPRSRSLSATRRLARRRPAFAASTRSPGRRPQIPAHVTPGERGPHQVAGWADTLHNIQFPRPYHSHFGRPHGDELVGIEGSFTVGRGIFQVPDNLNFLQAGFDYEQPSRPQQQQQPRLPTYDPPLPVQRGFTRSPNEDDVLVCPQCDDELGVGDNEVKKQVWVVKACGHVRVCYPSSLRGLMNVLGLLWRMCNQSVNKTKFARVLVQKSQALVEMCCRQLWQNGPESEKYYSGLLIMLVQASKRGEIDPVANKHRSNRRWC